jgi:carbonic anhydrase
MCNACPDVSLSRRKVLLAGAGLLAAAPFARMAQAQPVAAASTPDAALNLLIEGNARYVANQSPGDLFVVRVAGNFVTPEGLASLEFGAPALGTKLIMVLGHNKCGAVNATVTALQKGNTLPGHIADLVRAMKPGIERVLKQSGDDLEQRAVIANVRYNVERLHNAKPILAEMVAKNEVRVVGGVYDLGTGKVTLV